MYRVRKHIATTFPFIYPLLEFWVAISYLSYLIFDHCRTFITLEWENKI